MTMSRIKESAGDQDDAHHRETLHYQAASSLLGPVTVAVSEQGLCMIAFDTAEAGRNRLAARFPRAHLVPGEGRLEDRLAAVVAWIDAPASCDAASVALDMRGSAFQERVWWALTRIAPGSPISYSELAAAIGQPRAARAVAGACAANPLPVIVPCHRVIRRSGALGGYSGGIEKKRELLRREGWVESA